MYSYKRLCGCYRMVVTEHKCNVSKLLTDIRHDFLTPMRKAYT